MSFILSAKTVDLPGTFDEDQIRVDLGVREIPDVVLYGRITECNTDIPIVGATVAIFLVPAVGPEIKLCHTFSGCEGYYMLRIPPAADIGTAEINLEGATIRIMATADNCSTSPVPCECDIPETPIV